MSKVTFREARAEDLSALIALMADDPLGATREDSEGSSAAYELAFDEIAVDPNNLVVVAESHGQLIGTLQVTFIVNLSFEGGRRALVECVRVANGRQGQGIGRAMMRHAIEMARERDCKIVQLTSNKQRPETIKFYEGLGFLPSHVGFKLYL